MYSLTFVHDKQSLYFIYYIFTYIYYLLYIEYHMYQFIPLQSCDYLCEISLKANVATDESNDRNET